MSTACPTCPRTHSIPFPLILAGILVLLALASYHAVATHGQAAITAQNCFNNGGQVMKQIYYDPLTGRSMKFCNDQGHWFVSIDAPDGDNVTMFPRSFAKCLRDVVDYAHRSGFTRLMLPH